MPEGKLSILVYLDGSCEPTRDENSQDVLCVVLVEGKWHVSSRELNVDDGCSKGNPEDGQECISCESAGVG